MKKYLIVTLAMFVLGSFGVAFAQANTDSHDIRVRIPDLLMLRIIDGSGNAGVTAPVVSFDFDTNAAGRAAYIAAVEGTSTDPLSPTASNFTNIVVLSNRVSWTVDVVASNFNFTDNVVGEGEDLPGGAGLDVSDISVAITGANALPGLSGEFTLSTTQRDIAEGTRTQGWTSLGIAGTGYAIAVDGDEAPGTYVATVTYTITAP